ncbi:hypothetical protein OG948_52290 (plasmid) [Embleya sp. NBC_00888]|nr:hypothetical protein OG948_52290 [Embleya sp. NBC_00888]
MPFQGRDLVCGLAEIELAGGGAAHRPRLGAEAAGLREAVRTPVAETRDG